MESRRLEIILSRPKLELFECGGVTYIYFFDIIRVTHARIPFLCGWVETDAGAEAVLRLWVSSYFLQHTLGS